MSYDPQAFEAPMPSDFCAKVAEAGELAESREPREVDSIITLRREPTHPETPLYFMPLKPREPAPCIGCKLEGGLSPEVLRALAWLREEYADSKYKNPRKRDSTRGAVHVLCDALEQLAKESK